METIAILFPPRSLLLLLMVPLHFLFIASHFCPGTGTKRAENVLLKCPWFVRVWKWNCDRHRHISPCLGLPKWP